MTRVIGGVARGRRIKTPAGGATRPTSDRVREALFSALEATVGPLARVAFLDVYAGSGAVALEAASRGAAPVTAVERSRPASAVVRDNARSLGLSAVTVLTASAAGLASMSPPATHRVAFLDPPYDVSVDEVATVLSGLATAGWLAPQATVAVERSRRSPPFRWPAEFVGLRNRRYGDTLLWYGRWDPPPRSPAAAAIEEEG